MCGPLRNSRARWTTLRSSRTLPGQRCASSAVERCGREAAPSARAARTRAGSARPARRCPRGGRAAAAGQRHDAEPVVEVLAELALARAWPARSRLVAATTRTSTSGRSSTPDALDLAALERAQQLGLQVQRQLADLVEEERAAVRLLEGAPCARRDRAGERALLVAEQLALDELLGDGRAVDRDEGLLRARRRARGRRGRQAPCRCPTRRGSSPPRRRERPAR